MLPLVGVLLSNGLVLPMKGLVQQTRRPAYDQSLGIIRMSAPSALEVQLNQVATRVVAAAAAFGAKHEAAAKEYTSILLRPDVGVPDNAALLKWKVALFDGDTEDYSELVRLMNELQRLVVERRACESDRGGTDTTLVGLFRVMTGLDQKIEAKAAEVRQQAARYGLQHARAAVEWTERLVSGQGPSGNAYAATSNAALLEQRVALFEECEVATSTLSAELSFEVASRCDELKDALEALLALKAKVVLAEARSAGPAGLAWRVGDPMPAQLAEWGCDDELWEAVKNKRALVRLANTEGGEARCRLRLAKLRQVVVEEEAAERAAARAARRAARSGLEFVPSNQPAEQAGSMPVPETVQTKEEEEVVVVAVGMEDDPDTVTMPDTSRGGKQAFGAARATTEPTKQRKKRGRKKKEPRPQLDPTQTEEYRSQIPERLRAWGCDQPLWDKVKKKNALRRLAQANDEEHGRRRIKALREQLLSEI